MLRRTLDNALQQRIALAWAAVLSGGLMAAASLWYEGRTGTLPEGVVAQVGSQPIARAQWLRALQAVEGDRGFALDATGRRAVLQRLVDEELLYQHAVDSGLARDDPGLRKTLIAGLIEATAAGSGEDEAGARALFERDPGYFAAQPRLKVRAYTAPSGTALEAGALDGATLPSPLQALTLADTPLSLPQLAQQLGGSAAQTLQHAQAGQTLGPLPYSGRQLYLRVLERQADAPRYEDVAAAVRTEWSRREAEAALSRLLETLRETTPVRMADDAR